MNQKEIPDSAIDTIAEHIVQRTNKPSRISVVTSEDEAETPHYFEIIPFDQIDSSNTKFFAIDGSYNSQEFYNGLSVGVYTAGYICFQSGKQVRLNELLDPIILGKSYLPDNILITNQDDAYAVFDELLELEPVKKLLAFFNANAIEDIWGFGKGTREAVCSAISKLLFFCQEILEWALILEIASLECIQKGDFILRDGTLRSNNIKQEYLVKLGRYIHERGFIVLAVTKNSPIKLESSSTFKKIDYHLQVEKKPKYPFKTKNSRWQKLCCWLEVPDDFLDRAYKGGMYAKKGISGGRGFGLFFVARLDYVEKLQNYDWVVVDLNIFDACPGLQENNRNIPMIKHIFNELTRLTQEHYILGYPYPLVEAHNFVTLKRDFNDVVVKRLKAALYNNKQMDHVDIENLFLDIHERF